MELDMNILNQQITIYFQFIRIIEIVLLSLL